MPAGAGWLDSSELASISEGRFQTHIEGARPGRAYRAGIGEWRAAIGEVGDRAGIVERSIGRVAIIQDIIGTRVDLEGLVDLIRGVEVENGIRSQSLRLIGFVTDEILTADEQRISSDLEGVGDRIIDAGLDAIAGDGRDPVSRQYLDVAVGVGEGAVGADLKCVKAPGVDEGVTRI